MPARKPKYSPDPALSMPAFYQYISRMDRDQLQNIGAAIRERHAQLQNEARDQLKSGDVVWFDARRRGIVRGVIQHFNRKRVVVQSTAGTSWRVSPTLLTLVADKKDAAKVRKLVNVTLAKHLVNGLFGRDHG